MSTYEIHKNARLGADCRVEYKGEHCAGAPETFYTFNTWETSKLIWEIQVVLPPNYGIELSWPEPKGGCKPLLTEKGVQLIEELSHEGKTALSLVVWLVG